MQVKIQLRYDASLSFICPEQVTVMIEGQGYRNCIPGTELSPELWQKISVSPDIFLAEISEDEFSEYINWRQVFRLQDIKEIGEIIEELEFLLPGINPLSISNGFLRFWNADQRTEYVYGGRENVLEAINSLKQDFIDNCNYGDSLAQKTAQETGLEWVPPNPDIYPGTRSFDFAPLHWGWRPPARLRCNQELCAMPVQNVQKVAAVC